MALEINYPDLFIRILNLIDHFAVSKITSFFLALLLNNHCVPLRLDLFLDKSWYWWLCQRLRISATLGQMLFQRTYYNTRPTSIPKISSFLHYLISHAVRKIFRSYKTTMYPKLRSKASIADHVGSILKELCTDWLWNSELFSKFFYLLSRLLTI